MRKTFAILLIVLACLIGGLTILAVFQVAWDVMSRRSPGVTSDAIGLLPLLGFPIIVVTFLAVIGRALLKRG